MHRSGLSILSAVFSALALGACVTINIYFPAAAAERAADRIIDEVLQLKPSEKPPASKSDAAGSPAKKPPAAQ
jgi:hypothetical protein